MDDKQKIEKEKEIIIARLKTVASDFQFAEGDDDNSCNRDDMIKLIQDNDAKGLEYVKSEFEFLRALKNGEIVQRLTGAR